MSGNQGLPLVVNGWAIFAHPLFLAQLETITRQVEGLKQKDPAGFIRKNAAKRLAAIVKLAFDVIPQDPSRAEYRQGNTLGDDHKHWFRAKFFQQYRLFFRYHAPSKVIVLAWGNDEDSKRAYESSDDADWFQQFIDRLDAPPVPNEGLERLMAVMAPWENSQA